MGEKEAPSPSVDRLADIPLAEWQLVAEKAGDRLTGHIRHCTRNAFDHLRRAWRLHDIDNQMSAFRAITAEEEAATALILALKRQLYPGADRLNPRNHVHKSALWPLISALGGLFYDLKIPGPQIVISGEGPPRVTLRINMTKLAGHDGEPVWMEPDHPLNFEIRTGPISDKVVHLFEEELAAIASNAGDQSIRVYVERQANQRNRLLYASDKGLPDISFTDNMLLARAHRVSILAILTVIVLQTPQHQQLVLQCLEALLRALDAIGSTIFDYGEEVERAGFLIDRTGPGPGRISFSRPFEAQVRWEYNAPGWSWPPSQMPAPKDQIDGQDAPSPF